jgi:hypothetical protein
MGRLAATFLGVTGRVALQVVAQAAVLVSVRFVARRTRGAAELRRRFWISLGAVVKRRPKPEAQALLFVLSVLAIRRGGGSAAQEPVTETYEERRRQHGDRDQDARQGCSFSGK